MNIQLYKFRFLFVALMVSFFACSGDEDIDVDQQIQEYLTTKNISATKLSSGSYYAITNAGSADHPEASDFVLMHFRQSTLAGTELSSSFGTSTPMAISMTDLKVLITSLSDVLPLMGAGGKATVLIAPGSGGSLVQGSKAEVFEIELVNHYSSLSDYNDGQINDYLTEKGLTAQKTSSGIYYTVEEAGIDPTPTADSQVTVHYHGYLLSGDVFDSSVDRGEPATFALNVLIEGWKEGLRLYGTGGKGKLFIPSYLAYGSDGSRSIPPNYPIAFDIELIEVQ